MKRNAREEIVDYYQRRAAEYDRIYSKPEQQADFARLREWLSAEVAGKDVLEVACGTGCWTAVAAPTAKSIRATDINAGPLEVAEGRRLGAHIRFQIADAYELPGFETKFDVALAAFWCSHVSKPSLPKFFSSVARTLKDGGSILLIDSKWVEGYRKSPTDEDEEGNTYQTRRLDDGSSFRILKNFLSRDEIETAFREIGLRVQFLELDYLWAVKAVVRL